MKRKVSPLSQQGHFRLRKTDFHQSEFRFSSGGEALVILVPAGGGADGRSVRMKPSHQERK